MGKLSRGVLDNGPFVAWTWLLVSFFFTFLIVRSLSIEPISLFDDSCSRPTTSECNALSKDAAKKRVELKLLNSLKKLRDIRESFPLLKLVPNVYGLSVRNRGSESQWRISSPPQVFVVGKISLMCAISGKQEAIKNWQQIEFATIRLTNEVRENVDSALKKFDTHYGGCNYFLTEQNKREISEFQTPPNNIIAPDGVLSLKMSISPYLVFGLGSWLIMSLWLIVFALGGAFLALLKQFFTIARRGLLYFDDTQ